MLPVCANLLINLEMQVCDRDWKEKCLHLLITSSNSSCGAEEQGLGTLAAQTDSVILLTNAKNLDWRWMIQNTFKARAMPNLLKNSLFLTFPK